MIERRLYPNHDLVVHTVIGELEEEEFLAAGVALYTMDPPPSLSLWDLSKASVAQYTLDRMRTMQSAASEKVRGREGGKTAVVAPHDREFAASRQYVGFAESFDLPFEHRIFRSTGEAFEWLGIDVDQLDDTTRPDTEVKR